MTVTCIPDGLLRNRGKLLPQFYVPLMVIKWDCGLNRGKIAFCWIYFQKCFLLNFVLKANNIIASFSGEKLSGKPQHTQTWQKYAQ